MTLTFLAALAFVFAIIPAYFFTLNQFRFQSPPKVEDSATLPAVPVLIPARNEETSIGPCIESVLANRGLDFEILVLDDQSEDETAQVVAKLSDTDSRVRLFPAEPLPPIGAENSLLVINWRNWQVTTFSFFLMLTSAFRPMLCGVRLLICGKRRLI